MSENEKHQGRKKEWLNLPRRKCDNCGASYKPKRPVKPKEHGFCKDPCRFQFHRNGGSFVKLKALIEPAVRKAMRLEEICPDCDGKGTLKKSSGSPPFKISGSVVCENCINGRVLTPFGRDVLRFVTSGHVEVTGA